METKVIVVSKDSRDRERVGEFLDAGEPDRLIQAAVAIPELTWADVASQAAEACKRKAEGEAMGNNPKAAQESIRKEWQFRKLASKLREEKVRRANGQVEKLKPPTQDEMRTMFGETAVKVGQGKPRR